MDIVSAGYDAVYTAMPSAPTLQRLWREHACGRDFPPDFYHISFVTLDEARRIADELRLEPGDTFVDLGAGAGGPALWLARETGAQLIGVDASPVGVAVATRRAAELGLGATARFTVGTFADTGLESASVDAAVSEDALQYAPDKRAAFVEAARILRPGGRFAFTAFELAPERVAGLPVLGVDPVADYAPLLAAAGFTLRAYEEVPGWPEPMTAGYQAIVDAKDALIAEMGQPAVDALLAEVALTLQIRPYRRRVLISATR